MASTVEIPNFSSVFQAASLEMMYQQASQNQLLHPNFSQFLWGDRLFTDSEIVSIESLLTLSVQIKESSQHREDKFDLIARKLFVKALQSPEEIYYLLPFWTEIGVDLMRNYRSVMENRELPSLGIKKVYSIAFDAVAQITTDLLSLNLSELTQDHLMVILAPSVFPRADSLYQRDQAQYPVGSSEKGILTLSEIAEKLHYLIPDKLTSQIYISQEGNHPIRLEPRIVPLLCNFVSMSIYSLLSYFYDEEYLKNAQQHGSIDIPSPTFTSTTSRKPWLGLSSTSIN